MSLDLTAIPTTGIAIVVDGGCTNNNLPENTRALYGSFAVFKDGKRVEKVTHYDQVFEHQYRWEANMPLWHEAFPGIPATNNVAECEMMAQALTYAIRISKQYKNIVFLCDSQVVESYTKPDTKFNKDAKHLKEWHEAIASRFQDNVGFTFKHLDNQIVKGILGH